MFDLFDNEKPKEEGKKGKGYRLFVDFDKIRIKKKPKEIKIEIKEKEKEEKPKKKLIPSKKGKQLFK